MASTSAEGVLLAKIAAIAKVNSEILGRIEEDGSLRSTYVYSMQVHSKGAGRCPRCDRYTTNSSTRTPSDKYITLSRNERSRNSLLDEENPELVAVKDFFNDKIDYEVQNFEDLVRLNKVMIEVADKYRLFGPTEYALQTLEQFKTNYELIHVAVGKIESRLEKEKGVEQTFTEKIQDLNKKHLELEAELTNLKKEMEGTYKTTISLQYS